MHACSLTNTPRLFMLRNSQYTVSYLVQMMLNVCQEFGTLSTYCGCMSFETLHIFQGFYWDSLTPGWWHIHTKQSKRNHMLNICNALCCLYQNCIEKIALPHSYLPCRSEPTNALSLAAYSSECANRTYQLSTNRRYLLNSLRPIFAYICQ